MANITSVSVRRDTKGKTLLALNIERALSEHANKIRRLGKRAVENVIEIGRRLAECKQLLGHGNWSAWLARQFGWSERQAERFMRVCELAGKSDNLSDLEIPLSALYLLAAPSTRQSARNEILDRAAAGKKVSVTEVKDVIQQYKASAGAGSEVDDGDDDQGEDPTQPHEVNEASPRYCGFLQRDPERRPGSRATLRRQTEIGEALEAHDLRHLEYWFFRRACLSS